MSSAAEWQRSGLTSAQLRSLTRSGDLVRVRPGIYASRRATDWAQASPMRGHALRVIVARASVGRDSVASHQTAALLHGLDLFPAAPDTVTLTRPPTRRRSGRRRADGVFFHTAELPDEHVARKLGAAVTTVPRTIVDLARVSPFMSAVVTADSALRADLTTKAAMLAVCSDCAGWPGVRQARQVVDFADGRAESVLETCARVVFAKRGLPSAELQATITGPNFRYSVDFYWPGHNLIAEADGDVKYADPSRARRQLARDQQLRDLGYKVVHFTWRELFGAPSTVAGRISKAFASPTAI